MNAHIMSVGQPQFFFIRREPDTMAWIAMSSYGSCIPSFYFNTRKFFPGYKITDLKAKQAVNRCIHQRLFTIDGKRANEISKRTNFIYNGISLCIHDIQPW